MSTPFIGRQIDVGVGKESVRGTAVAPTFWLPAVSKNVDDAVEYAVDEAGRGVIEGDADALVVKKWAEGDIEGFVRDDSIGLLLLNVFGSVSSALKSGESVVYEHDFSVNQSVQHQSLTLAMKHPVENIRFALAMINTFELTIELGAYVGFTANFMGKLGTSSSDTVSYVCENEFVPQHVEVKFADNLAGLGAASAVSVKSATLSINKNVETDDVVGNVEPNDILNKEFRVEGTLELLYDDTTYKALALAGTQKALRLDIANSDVTIGTASNPQLTIDMAKVKLTEFSRTGGNNDMVRQALTFMGYFSCDDAEMITAKLTNETASY